MLALAIIEINWLPVCIATIAAMIAGWVWYGPLFGKAWLKAVHKTAKEVQSEGSGSWVYVQTALVHFVMALTLSVVINAFGVANAAEGFSLGLLIGCGLLFMSHARQMLFLGNRPLIVLNAFYDVTIITLMSTIIGMGR